MAIKVCSGWNLAMCFHPGTLSILQIQFFKIQVASNPAIITQKSCFTLTGAFILILEARSTACCKTHGDHPTSNAVSSVAHLQNPQTDRTVSACRWTAISVVDLFLMCTCMSKAQIISIILLSQWSKTTFRQAIHLL